VHLTIYTQVLNPFHHRQTHQQDQEYTPKCHDDSAIRKASPGRRDLPHVRFGIACIKVVNSLPNISAQGASHPLKNATACYSDKIRHRLMEVVLSKNYMPSWLSKRSLRIGLKLSLVR
jgi:hypothetical protein